LRADNKKITFDLIILIYLVKVMFENTGIRIIISRYYFFFLLTGLLLSCKQESSGGSQNGFVTTPQEFTVSSSELVEASGIADSKTNLGYLWVEQDSGNPPELFLMKHDGAVGKRVHLANVDNRDWEDMVLSSGPEPGKPYLYIAETGDNLLVHPDYAIYRLEEPASATDTVKQIDKIAFFYPDGSHNAEAMLVDAATGDIYIITKNDLKSKIFKLAYPYSTTGMNKAEEIGSLPYDYVVSAAMLPNGKEIVVKTYDAIYYYPYKSGETILQSLSSQLTKLPYQQEPQGEAIAFAADNSGYFTISEKALASSVKLYFYKRK